MHPNPPEHSACYYVLLTEEPSNRASAQLGGECVTLPWWNKRDMMYYSPSNNTTVARLREGHSKTVFTPNNTHSPTASTVTYFLSSWHNPVYYTCNFSSSRCAHVVPLTCSQSQNKGNGCIRKACLFLVTGSACMLLGVMIYDLKRGKGDVAAGAESTLLDWMVYWMILWQVHKGSVREI